MQGRTKLANHLAFKTSMTVEEANTMLEMSEKTPDVVAAAPAPIVAPVAAAGADFNAAMKEQGAIEVGAEHETALVTAESDPVAFAIQSMKQVG